MPYGLTDQIDAARAARRHFFKHVNGASDEQFAWKPYPQCKSIRETLVHLIWADRSARLSLENGAMPDWAPLSAQVKNETAELDRDTLTAMVQGEFDALLAWFSSRTHLSPDTPVCLWGDTIPLGAAAARLVEESFYHAGQVSFIRSATDPSWDYYAAIYSEP